MAIKNFIFDMGRVLIKYEPEKYIARLGLGEEDSQLLLEQVYLSLIWPCQDSGEIDEDDAISLMKPNIPPRLHKYLDTLVKHWDEPIEEVPDMYDFVAGLKAKGYGLYLLSNASRRQPEYWARSRFCELFDGTLISANERLVKPSKAIYERILQKFNLVADECVFIDDILENVKGAENVGIHGFQFTNRKELEEALKEIL